MIKALFLIFEPARAWERAAKRGLSFTVLFYFLPMIFIVGAVEGFGLVKWGRQQLPVGDIKKFISGEAIVVEVAEVLLMALIVLVAAHCVKMLGETFHGRHTYKQTLTVVIYGLSPVFLFRLLDVLPHLSLWIPWALGILLTAKILYHGVPIVMQPDPPHAFGLFLMSSLLLAMITAAERFISIGYLSGKFRPISHAVSHFAAHLHF